MNGRSYHGVNYLLLAASKFETPIYGTFNQIRQNGGQVRKGEHGDIVVYWDKFTPDEPDEEGSMKPRFFLKYYRVFNVEQAHFDDMGKAKIEALSSKILGKNNLPSEPAELIVKQMPNAPSIVFTDQDRAFYAPYMDTVNVPNMKYFVTSDEYYSTLFHELIHSTGHKTRLDRFHANSADETSKQNYSKEELVAELGASYLAAVAKLDHDLDNSAAYIKGWSRHLVDNPSWIVWASKRAQSAANYILNITEERSAE
jgi:antirestriction protein ArdC